MRIHAMDIDQPPGMAIAPMVDMEVHQLIVTATLAAKSAMAVPRKAGWEIRA
jgi:hypothetical protein